MFDLFDVLICQLYWWQIEHEIKPPYAFKMQLMIKSRSYQCSMINIGGFLLDCLTNSHYTNSYYTNSHYTKVQLKSVKSSQVHRRSFISNQVLQMGGWGGGWGEGVIIRPCSRSREGESWPGGNEEAPIGRPHGLFGQGVSTPWPASQPQYLSCMVHVPVN
jgi:hypothetical protein